MRAAITLAAISLTLGACSEPTEPAPEAESGQTGGTVRFLDLEGGCWIVETATGRVQPVNLPPEMMVDGLEVVMTVRDAPDVATACQAGTPRIIESIRRR